MENASKALIIAGAILLSILIIALGIYIYNQAKAAMNTDSLSSVEISTFNDPIVNYEGYSQIGSTVQSLISTLISNATTNAEAEEKLPTVNYVKGSGSMNSTQISGGSGAVGQNINNYKNNLTNLRKGLSSTHNYSVEIVSYNDSGYVSEITIDYSNAMTSYGSGS